MWSLYLIKVTTVAPCHNAVIHPYLWLHNYFVCTNNPLSIGVTADDLVPLTVLFYFDLSSDVSAWIRTSGYGNQLELTGISSYPKYFWLLYDGKIRDQRKNSSYPEIRVKRVWVNEIQLYLDLNNTLRFSHQKSLVTSSFEEGIQ